MASNQTIDQTQPTGPIQFERWYAKIAIAGFLLILLYTLFPYDFSLISSFSIQSTLRQLTLDGLHGLKDYLELLLHLLLFGVFSFGSVGVLRNRRWHRISTLGGILILCISLGMATELLQAILPGRHANLQDVYSSGIGGVVGWVVFDQWRSPICQAVLGVGQTFSRYLSLRNLMLGFVGYFFLSSVGLVLLPTATDFRNWDMSYPLLLGNEFTGERPWQGAITQVQFFDRALPPATVAQLLSQNGAGAIAPESLIASYTFTQTPEQYVDQTGNLADLSWTQPPLQPLGENGVLLNGEHWLRTAVPAALLNQRIQQNHALTLNLVAQPANLMQSGPARIVSLSQNSRNRNFTVGQVGNNLAVRLRTPTTGKNGSNPPIVVPQVFTDTSLRHLVITFTDSRLQVYVNDIQSGYTFQLPHLGYRLLHYAWVFIPLGCIMGLLMRRMGGGIPGWLMLWITCLVLPPLLLEAVMTSADQRSFGFENVVISWTFMLVALLFTRTVCRPYPFQQQAS